MLRDTTSRGLYVRVWPPHTSERRGGGGVSIASLPFPASRKFPLTPLSLSQGEVRSVRTWILLPVRTDLGLESEPFQLQGRRQCRHQGSSSLAFH